MIKENDFSKPVIVNLITGVEENFGLKVDKIFSFGENKVAYYIKEHKELCFTDIVQNINILIQFNAEEPIEIQRLSNGGWNILVYINGAPKVI